jgi:hypothetical protein
MRRRRTRFDRSLPEKWAENSQPASHLKEGRRERKRERVEKRK